MSCEDISCAISVVELTASLEDTGIASWGSITGDTANQSDLVFLNLNDVTGAPDTIGQFYVWDQTNQYFEPTQNITITDDSHQINSTDDLIINCAENKTLELSRAVYEDLQGSILSLKVQGTGLSLDETENSLDFNTAANLSDYAYDNYQMRHAWEIGTTVNPHIHWEQTEDNIPNWLFQYRWQKQGEAKKTAWTSIPFTNLAFTYVSGTLNQISYGTPITPPAGAGLSDIIQIRLYRDNGNASGEFSGADSYTATASGIFVDIHIQQNTGGSRQEYVK